MASKLAKLLKREPKRKLTQTEKFRLRYGEDYLMVLGTKYENPVRREKDYDHRFEEVLVPENFGGKKKK